MQSGDTGDYEFPLLPITGAYASRSRKRVSRVRKRPESSYRSSSSARFDVSWGGNISEKITVEAAAPVVNTETGSIGQVIENKKIVDLPLNGRNFVQLASLLPNAVIGTSGTVGGTVVAVSGGQRRTRPNTFWTASASMSSCLTEWCFGLRLTPYRNSKCNRIRFRPSTGAAMRS